MIRQQQTQIQQLQSQHQPSTSAVDDSTPTSERSMSIPILPHSTSQSNMSALQNPRSRSPYTSTRGGTMSRQSSFAERSRNSSHTGSPALRPSSSHGMLPHESGEFLPPSSITTRDESAFYQAETQNLTRENQMLKQRIRELGKSCLNPGLEKRLTCVCRTTARRCKPVARRDSRTYHVVESSQQSAH